MIQRILSTHRKDCCRRENDCLTVSAPSSIREYARVMIEGVYREICNEEDKSTLISQIFKFWSRASSNPVHCNPAFQSDLKPRSMLWGGEILPKAIDWPR